jgi:hypothetical protein
MAVPILRTFLMPSVRIPIRVSTPKSTLSPSMHRSFSSSPTVFATYNQVVKVRPLDNCHFSLFLVLIVIVGVSSSPTRSKSCVPSAPRCQRSRTQRRVSKSRDHKTKEAQLCRTENSKSEAKHWKGGDMLYSWRGS